MHRKLSPVPEIPFPKYLNETCVGLKKI
jgi:hypothetical protein